MNSAHWKIVPKKVVPNVLNKKTQKTNKPNPRPNKSKPSKPTAQGPAAEGQSEAEREGLPKSPSMALIHGHGPHGPD